VGRGGWAVELNVPLVWLKTLTLHEQENISSSELWNRWSLFKSSRFRQPDACLLFCCALPLLLRNVAWKSMGTVRHGRVSCPQLHYLLTEVLQTFKLQGATLMTFNHGDGSQAAMSAW
jgi:hypothetical protein